MNDDSLRFLLDLDAALARVGDGEAAVACAVRLLAGHLDADACAYDEVDADGRNASDATQAHGRDGVARVTIPIGEGHRIAVMTIERRGPRVWQDRDIAVATLVARRCRESLERAQAMREAKESAAQVRLVADHVPAKISYVDRDLRYRFNNAAYADWYGVDLSEIVGKHVRDVLGEETYQERLPYMMRALAGETVSFESRSDHRRLGMRMTEIACVPDVDASGDVRGFFVMGVDTTERKHAEEQLRENDRRKDEFIAMLAHELRNPLASLANALHLWPIVAHDEARVSGLRQMMERQVRQLTRLVDDLLDVSRISRGTIELRRELVMLGDVLRDALEAVGPQAEQRRQHLVVDDRAAAQLLFGDAARLTQVFGNVLNNASKYTHEGGTIRVATTREGGEVVVRIVDDGRGIPADMLERIFDMFVQVDPKLESRAGGLGIGLALSRRLIALHHGRIEARSGGPGCGTEVLVRLPVEGADAAIGHTASGDDSQAPLQAAAVPSSES